MTYVVTFAGGQELDLRDAKLCYLATPYSKYPEGLHCAFIDAAKLAARLLTAGLKVYSPISHSHPLALYGQIDPLDHNIWLPNEERLMALCDVLLVAEMRSWQVSYGISYEIAYFTKAGKPVVYLEPSTLRLSGTPCASAAPAPAEIPAL